MVSDYRKGFMKPWKIFCILLAILSLLYWREHNLVSMFLMPASLRDTWLSICLRMDLPWRLWASCAQTIIFKSVKPLKSSRPGSQSRDVHPRCVITFCTTTCFQLNCNVAPCGGCAAGLSQKWQKHRWWVQVIHLKVMTVATEAGMCNRISEKHCQKWM